MCFGIEGVNSSEIFHIKTIDKPTQKHACKTLIWINYAVSYYGLAVNSLY